MRNSTLIAVALGIFIAAFIITNYDSEEITQMFSNFDLTLNGIELDETEIQDEFAYFIAKHQKNYVSNGEYSERYQIFKDNYLYIQQHNLRSDSLGFSLGVNVFADLSNEEYQKFYLGLVPQDISLETKNTDVRHTFNNFLKNSRSDSSLAGLENPSSVDWRQKGAVKNMKNQGRCGSCWAFSAIAALESAYYIKQKRTVDLSEQQLVDCATDSYGCHGCNGGIMHGAYKYAQDNDICESKDYEYTATDDSCKDSKCNTNNYVEGYSFTKSGDRYSLYSALANQPVTVAVDASSREFQLYKSGILSTGCGTSLNHGVTAVGYSYNTFYWFWQNHYVIIKNSWGSGWGDNGYIHLGTNDSSGDGICGLYMYGAYPIVKK